MNISRSYGTYFDYNYAALKPPFAPWFINQNLFDFQKKKFDSADYFAAQEELK